MTDSTIVCPHCQKEIELSKVLSHSLEEKIQLEFDKKLAEEIKQKEKELKERVEKEQKESESKKDLELKDLKEQISAQKGRVEEMQKFELQLRKEKREIEEQKKAQQLEMERRLDEERKKIESSVTEKILEDRRLKEAEKDKVIADLKNALADMQKKANQGSQQTQGEVLELELEQILRKEFPNDQITEVKKGVRGADLIQEVFDRTGRSCGKILWESKNAEWSEGWLSKLREDQRNAKSDLCAIVSVVLPSGIKNFLYRDGVWICSLNAFQSLAYALRFNLITSQQVRSSLSQKDGKKDELYDYITGIEFKHRVEGMMEAYQNLLDDIEKEKRWFTLKWAKQEKSLRALIDQTGSFHGELEGIVGQSLPKVKQFILDSPEEKAE